MSHLDEMTRERLAAALDASDFAAAIDALGEARMTQRAVIHALGLSVVPWTLRQWRDYGRAPEKAWAALDALCTDEGWTRAVDARELYPDGRGRWAR